MDATMCTGNVTCDYPGAGRNGGTVGCTCLGTGPRIDGGARAREWNCVTFPAPRDAGAPADAGTGRCPNGTAAGDMCMTVDEVCRLNGGTNCRCLNNGTRNEWFCN
jgi:hypothetical protein